MRRNYYKISAILILYAIITASCANNKTDDKMKPVKVELIKETEGYRMYVNGEPFYMKGAGFEGSDPSSVAKHGGNTIRTWRTGDEFLTGKQKLDAAHENGLMVVLGLDVARERHGFDYDDEQAVKNQLEKLKLEVLKYKDHPALLAWGIGNELNLRYTNPKVWDAVNEISEMIKEIDPNHLTTTMLAGAAPDVVNVVAAQCPSLDFISFQLYGSIEKLPGYLTATQYNGAYALTEWGVTGHWEVPQTAWKRPIEENSHIKAMSYKDRYQNYIAADSERCIGSFVFLWGQKQERTPTWYGMFLETGEKTESVDVMHYLWTGNWPENRAPQLRNFYLNGKVASQNILLNTSQAIKASVEATDPNGDALTYRWEILPEVPLEQQSDGGDFEPRPKTIFSAKTIDNNISLEAPDKPGEYRLFVYVFDGNGNAATANIPFFVN
jgi:hypothetical protein